MKNLEFLFNVTGKLWDVFCEFLGKTYCQIKSVLYSGLILGLHPANEKRHYRVTPSLIGWAQT